MGQSELKMIELQIKQSSDEWHEHRFRCVTGTKLESAIGASYSNAKNEWVMNGKTWVFDGDKLVVDESKKLKPICRKKQNTLLLELVAEHQSILEIDDYCSADMERGNDLEPLSVDAASKKHGVKFETCGMLQSDTYSNFKFSPDAVFKDKNGVVVGGYETKSKAGKKHIEYMIDGVLPSEHLMQCLCPMIMDDCVKWWLFGHYDDRNMIDPLFTVGIKRENYEDFINDARIQLEWFLGEVSETVKKLGGEYNG